jgi:Ca2+-transporting ATPase
MGTGCSVAKDASDMILMDDNFESTMKAVMWGRTVRQNIQKFLQFQLTVNVVALVIAFVMAAIGRGEPLTPVQLLWVNLIQDTFAALALATEKPSETVLDEKPAGRNERLITPIMIRNILLTSAWELGCLFFILFGGEQAFGVIEDEGVDREHNRNVLYTIVFNTFVFMQLFNEINARRIDRRWNCFERFFSNPIFLVIVGGTIAAQVLLINVGGIAFRVIRLNWKYWLISIGFGLSMFPFGVILRVLIPPPEFAWLKYQKGAVLNDGKKRGDGNGEVDKVYTDKDEMELPTV